MRTLRLGDEGEAVKCWERALHLAPTGKFDQGLDAATRSFQMMRGLNSDGIVGPKTWTAARGFEVIAGEPCVHVVPRAGRPIWYQVAHHSNTATVAGMVRALNSAPKKNKSTHASIDLDGVIRQHADPLEWIAWHCVGANLHGIGFDLIHRRGRPFTAAQIEAAGKWMRWNCLIHGLPQVAAEGRFPAGKGQLGRQAWGVIGHGQVQATRCPDGFPVAAALAEAGHNAGKGK